MTASQSQPVLAEDGQTNVQPSAADIDPRRVEEIMALAVADHGAPIEGIVRTFNANRATIAEHRDEIIAMLSCLPDEFMDDGGGGWSFLNLCQTKDGRLWTGMHATCEALYGLAAGLDLASFLLPREVWGALPGGMPYLAFRRSAFATAEVATPEVVGEATPSLAGSGSESE